MENGMQQAVAARPILGVLGCLQPRYALTAFALASFIHCTAILFSRHTVKEKKKNSFEPKKAVIAQASPLLRLPGEVRNAIYEAVSGMPLKVRVHRGEVIAPPLARTCRQTRLEYWPYFLGSAFSAFEVGDELFTTLDLIQIAVEKENKAQSSGVFESSFWGFLINVQEYRADRPEEWKMFARERMQQWEAAIRAGPPVLPRLLRADDYLVEYQSSYSVSHASGDLEWCLDYIRIMKIPEGNLFPELVLYLLNRDGEGTEEAQHTRDLAGGPGRKFQDMEAQHDSRLVKRQRLDLQGSYQRVESASYHSITKGKAQAADREHWSKVIGLSRACQASLQAMETRAAAERQARSDMPGGFPGEVQVEDALHENLPIAEARRVRSKVREIMRRDGHDC